MAILVIQQPQPVCFATEIRDIIIASPSAVNFRMKIDDQTVLLENYQPDSENRITIRDIEKVINSYFGATLILPVQFIFTTTASDSLTITTSVHYCTAHISIPASAFLHSYFLTMLRGKKITTATANEYLSLAPTEETSVIARIKYNDGTIIQTDIAQTLPQDTVTTLDVSPSVFPQMEKILHYVILAGGRQMTYLLRPTLPADRLTFTFSNAFGVKETFTPTGLLTRENKYDQVTGIFDGSFRRSDPGMVREYTANTGFLDESTTSLVEDFFMSRNTHIQLPNRPAEEITILSATLQRSSNPAEMPAFEFKFRYAGNAQHRFNPTAPSDIFDQTFDYSFN
jgi:hypothetical protein